jgi:hypothetical protein
MAAVSSYSPRGDGFNFVGEIKDSLGERRKAGVVPGIRQFAPSWFLAKNSGMTCA